MLTEGRSAEWYKPCGRAVACVRRPVCERMAQVDGILYMDTADQVVASGLRSLMSSLGRGELGDGLGALRRQHAECSDVLPGQLPAARMLCMRCSAACCICAVLLQHIQADGSSPRPS